MAAGKLAAALLLVASAAPAQAARVFLDSSGKRDVFQTEWQKRLSPWTLLAFKPRSLAAPAVDPDSGDIIAAGREGVHALTQDGRELWSTRLPADATSTPAVTEEGIYLGAEDGRVHALDRFTGEHLWATYVAGMVLSQPVVRGDLVLVGTDHDTVQALEKGTGKIKWTYPREGAAELTIRGGTGLSLGGNRVYAGFSDGSAVALAPEDGRLLWEARLGTAGNNTFPDVVAAPVYQGGTVYAASFAEGVSALDAATGQVRWKHAVRGMVALAMSGDLLYAGGTDVALALRPANGAAAFQVKLGEDAAVVAPPVVAGEVLMLPTQRGILVIDAKRGKPLGVWNPGSGFSASPATRERAVFAMSNDGFLYRMRLLTRR